MKTIPKKNINLPYLFLITFICSFVSINLKAQTSAELPSGTKENYLDYRDASISDEFNDPTLDTNKWGRRNSGNATTRTFDKDPDLLKMESEPIGGGQSVKYVSIKATANDGPIRTTGIVSKASGFYGFYVTKFRYRGLDTPEVRADETIWHPAIWGGRLDNIDDGAPKQTAGVDFWLELDFMEWDNLRNGWGSHTNARLKDSEGVRRNITPDEKAKMKDHVDVVEADWQTVGIEYSPDHLKLWKWNGTTWTLLSDRTVSFIDDNITTPENGYTVSTIGKKSRSPVFWLLGNIVANFILTRVNDGTNTKTMADMSFDIDYFRYYRHTASENLNWRWENQLANGSNEIMRFDSELSLNDYESTKTLFAYPNPVKDQLKFQNDSNEWVSLKIIDVSGKHVIQMDKRMINELNVKKSLDVSDLKKGFYLLKVTTSNHVKAFKFMKK